MIQALTKFSLTEGALYVKMCCLMLAPIVKLLVCTGWQNFNGFDFLGKVHFFLNLHTANFYRCAQKRKNCGEFCVFVVFNESF